MEILGFTVGLLELITVIIAFLGLCISIFSIRQNTKSINSSLIVDVIDAFSAEKMKTAMEEIKGTSGESPEKLRIHLENEEFDNNRRILTHHFLKIYLLYQRKVIDKKILKTLAQKEDVKILLDCLEPLEKEKRKMINLDNHNVPMFNLYRKLLCSGFYEKTGWNEIISNYRPFQGW
jgi:hypothetical protein